MDVARPHDKPIEIKNKEVLKTLWSVGSFKSKKDPKFANLTLLGPYIFEANLAIYSGQWKTGKREGNGK